MTVLKPDTDAREPRDEAVGRVMRQWHDPEAEGHEDPCPECEDIVAMVLTIEQARRRPRSSGEMTATRRNLVTTDLRHAVLLRDGACMAFKFGFPHVCRNQWGKEHSPYALTKLTLDHVKEQPMCGQRARSDLGHCVALCWGLNVGVPSKELRTAEREYLGL